MSRAITVRHPGLLSLVQDAGRSGFQRYGVSVSGAVDQEALLIGNLLVGNEPGAAAIEVTFGGAEFEFLDDSVAAITGGDLQATLDGTPLSIWESFVAPAGSTLRLASPVTGLRSYVAVDGGIDTSPVLGSRSTHVSSGLGGLSGGPIKAGDTLPLGDSSNPSPGAQFPLELRVEYNRELTVRVIPGPQHAQFTSAGTHTFFSSEYTVTESSDRQGLRLDGPGIEAVNGRYDIVSDAVVFGAVQVPGDGKPIVLLSDSQTTGGYAKIGVVASVDLPLLAQASPGSQIQFEEVSAPEAQALLKARRTAILATDMLSQLEHAQNLISINGESMEVGLAYRSRDLLQPGGSLAYIDVNGARSTVRIEEIT